MTESLNFTSSIRRSEPLAFTVDGNEYHVIPAKEALALLSNKYQWFDAGLNDYDWAQLDDDAKRAAHTDEEGRGPGDVPGSYPDGWRGPQAAVFDKRLTDRHDGFDIPDLDRIIDAIQEKVAARPTT